MNLKTEIIQAQLMKYRKKDRYFDENLKAKNDLNYDNESFEELE